MVDYEGQNAYSSQKPGGSSHKSRGMPMSNHSSNLQVNNRLTGSLNNTMSSRLSSPLTPPQIQTNFAEENKSNGFTAAVNENATLPTRSPYLHTIEEGVENQRAREGPNNNTNNL